MPLPIKTIINKIAKNKKQLIISGTIVVILSILYSFVLPSIIDIDKHREEVLRLSKAEERVNGKLTLGKMGLELPITGGIVITFSTVKLNHYDGKPIFSAKNVKCKFAILPLIFKDLVIKNLEADNFKLHTTRDTEDHLTIQDAFKPPFPDDIFVIRFWGTRANVTGYEINLKDETIQPTKAMLLEGKTLQLLGLTEDKDIRFKAVGLLDKANAYNLEAFLKFPLKEDLITNRLFLKGDISDFNLNSIHPYLPLKGIEGIITSKFNIDLRNKSLYILNKTDILEPLVIPELQLTIKDGNIGINADINPEKIRIHRLLSNLNNTPLEIKGKILNWQSTNPEPRLYIKTSIFDIQDLYSLIPELPETKDILEKLNTSQLSGKTQLEIKLNGSLKNIKAYGKLILKKYSLSLPGNLIIKNITGKFNFDGDKIQIHNWLIPLTSTNLVQINGVIDHKKMTFDHLDVSTNDINLKKLKTTILSAAQFADYDIPLLSNIYLNGISKAHLDFNGKMEKPDITGNLLIDAKGIQFKNIYQPIEKIKGLISFEKTKLNIKNLNINISKTSKLNINGIYQFYNSEIETIKIFSKNLNLKHVQNIVISITSLLQIPNNEIKLISITGNSNVNIDLKGELDALKPYGLITISNINITENKTNTSVSNINGEITFNENINLNNLTATLLNNPLSISGIVQLNGDAKLNVKLPNFKLSDIKILADHYGLIGPKEKALINGAKIDGSISGEISLIKTGEIISPEANIKVNKSRLSHQMLYDDIFLTKGDIQLTSNTMNIHDLTMGVSGSTFTISGNIDNLTKPTPNYALKATSNDFNYALLKNIGAHETTPKGIKTLLEDIKSMSGKTNINAVANNNSFQVNVKLSDVSIETSKLDNPIKNIDGEIIVGSKLISLDKVTVDYEGSNILIDGALSNLDATPYIDAKISGQLSPLSFKEFYIKDIQDNLVFSKPIIFDGYAKGNIHSWDIAFKSEVPPETTIAIKGFFKKPENVPVSLMIDGKGSNNRIDIDQITFKVGDSSFNANGMIEYTDNDELTINNLHIVIPTINLDEINGFLEKGLLSDNLTGDIKTDLNISGPALSPNVVGYINFIKVSLPMLKTKDVSFNIDIEGNKANIKNAHLNINGVVFELSTYVKNYRKIPIELTNLNVYSPSLRLTDLLDSLSTKTQDISINYIPIMIKNGLLTVDDAILEKLITSNLKGTINLCPNGNFQINDISLETAGGTANGNLYVNLLNNSMGAQLQVIGIKANAAASVLLDLPNEVFGDLNATIVFDSHGEEYEEIIANAEGEASLIINDGRFSKLGTLEYLLKATNIINGGIAGLNLNNILSTVIPMKTGSFEQLTGDFTVKKGILKTDNLISRGKNLSLEVSGDYNIENDDADLNIKGNLSRNVSGLLGPLGNLNIETLTDFIPGLGFIPGISTKKRRLGLLDFIPGLGFIPGFGGPGKRGKKVRKFAVEIQGKLYEKSSVKNFRWTK